MWRRSGTLEQHLRHHFHLLHQLPPLLSAILLPFSWKFSPLYGNTAWPFPTYICKLTAQSFTGHSSKSTDSIVSLTHCGKSLRGFRKSSTSLQWKSIFGHFIIFIYLATSGRPKNPKHWPRTSSNLLQSRSRRMSLWNSTFKPSLIRCAPTALCSTMLSVEHLSLTRTN